MKFNILIVKNSNPQKHITADSKYVKSPFFGATQVSVLFLQCGQKSCLGDSPKTKTVGVFCSLLQFDEAIEAVLGTEIDSFLSSLSIRV